ncbi:MAG TPA: beta-ketoacyl synthase chain length factor [Steroidobacteraceae bacterium]|nr:beta-ketoacyl synthase chain length factor [Steroidobacteraceae bacterium]
MPPLLARIEGVGLLGPGLLDWARSQDILGGRSPYRLQATVLPVPEGLPPAERRRVGQIVKIALAVGTQAIRDADANPTDLASVFTSSGGDGQNCHEICRVLAQEDRQLSPTRFHNSVHNAAAGYWSIANGATAPSNAVCAFDASFAAGLLEAITQVALEKRPVLLVAYDAAYPSPLDEKRPIADAFGVALVLGPEREGQALSSQEPSRARIRVSLADAAAECLTDPQLESLRASIPAARSLPLLIQLARREPGRVGVEYLDGRSLAIEVL